MHKEFTEISIKGKSQRVMLLHINNISLVIVGKWIKVAKIHDSLWNDYENIGNLKEFILKLKNLKSGADIFSFSQKLPYTEPLYNIPVEWNNLAVIPITNYEEWWNKRLPQATRKNVRRSERMGVTIKIVNFDDRFIQDIVRINNETPIRQGRHFWHYGKSFQQVKADYLPYLERSIFVGAYYQDELIGFLRLVNVGKVSGILQLLCLNGHYDKRPANALLAKAVEICVSNNHKFLFYGQYTYGNNLNSPLTEFKRRNGFEKIMIPSYSVPLTIKGTIAVRLGIHNGVRSLFPASVRAFAARLRRSFLKKKAGKSIETFN